MFPVHTNESGSFQELAHTSDVVFGQLSLLTIKPGCTRGGHYHTRKVEWFCCLHGSCVITMTNIKTGATKEVKLNGRKREFSKIEPWMKHHIKNTGKIDCELLIIISEEYDINNPDTFQSEE
jgi:UDP-2-acetamido-2,6-beta-L-arabino-hexul-4-ose reductase